MPNNMIGSNVLEKARQPFKKKSIRLAEKERAIGDYLLIWYEDYCHPEVKSYESEGSFFLYSGTLFFNKKTGTDALRQLESELKQNRRLEDLTLTGNFVLVLFFKGKVQISQDILGGYACFTDDKKAWFTSNFVSASFLNSHFGFNKQEYQEYCLFGLVFGRKTVLEGIETTDPTLVYELTSTRTISKKFKIPELIYNKSECLELNVQAVLSEFENYKIAYSESIATALSGGYDTRLMLAACLNLGLLPKLYVYGRSTDKDVIVAKNIAKGEGYLLEHFDNSINQNADATNLVERIRTNFWDFDSFGNLFSGEQDMKLRLARTKESRLVLHGWGGAIYRDIWITSIRNIRLGSLIRLFYDTGEVEGFGIDPHVFWENIEQKVFSQAKPFGISDKIIDQELVDRVFFLHRVNFNHTNTIINGYLGNSVMPFTAEGVALNSFSIPNKFKKFGVFESEMIKTLHPKIASYNSEYGFDFFSGPSFKHKIKQTIQRALSPNLKTFLRAVYSSSNKSTQTNPFKRGDIYFNDENVSAIFKRNPIHENSYLRNAERIKNKNHINRIFALEMLQQIHNQC